VERRAVLATYRASHIYIYIYIPSFECPVAGIGAGRAARHELRQQHLGATARNMRLSAQRNKRNI
jgi:hypothetical protein